MTFLWTPHRFSGGALALDVANSVILRFDPERRTDRYADHTAMDAFADAANIHCADAGLFGRLTPVEPDNRKRFLGLRETIDAHFRAEVLGQSKPAHLADLLDAVSAVIRCSGPAKDGMPLDTATARSALMLATHPEPQRLKICANCQWLFLDRSRNRSRLWCDMAVCGNRAKAKRHYDRQREEA